MTQLTIFYDSYCPLCVAEMKKLAKRDSAGKLQLEDIHAADFANRYPTIDRDQANRVLLGQLANGKLVRGLDTTYHAWRLVGRGFLIAPLRWPLVKPLADRCYLWFARHRYQVSALLTGQSRCQRCVINREQNHE